MSFAAQALTNALLTMVTPNKQNSAIAQQNQTSSSVAAEMASQLSGILADVQSGTLDLSDLSAIAGLIGSANVANLTEDHLGLDDKKKKNRNKYASNQVFSNPSKTFGATAKNLLNELISLGVSTRRFTFADIIKHADRQLEDSKKDQNSDPKKAEAQKQGALILQSAAREEHSKTKPLSNMDVDITKVKEATGVINKPPITPQK